MKGSLASWIAATAATAAAAVLALAIAPAPAGADEPGITRTPAMAEFGAPLYGPDMVHWNYVNPDAPKGGTVAVGAFGSFDTLNPLIEKGMWPAGIGLTGDSLMTGSADELMAVYGLIAGTAEFPADKSWIAFNLRPEARWHDGAPIVADDFVYTFDFIRQHGRLFLRSFYDDVDGCRAEAPQRLMCTMRTRDTMKPLMAAARLSPMPRHWWGQAGRDPTRTTLEPVLSSGPYRVKAVDQGRSITYERVRDYWASGLPVQRGLNNFDEIRYDYYRDDSVMFEAFMAGRADFWTENKAQRWATGYDTEAVRAGKVVRREVPENTPRGMAGYVFNTRRPLFQDIRIRKALNFLYDFETTRRQLLHGQYRRVKTWFPNSEYGASGPPRADELALLEPLRDRLGRDRLPADVLTSAFEPPSTDGSGNNRANVREAMRLFKEAGWEPRDGKLVNSATGAPLTFEFLLRDPGFVRVTEPFVTALKRAGIEASIRVVDTAQYKVRLDDYDFDIVNVSLTFFPPPGTELRSYFASPVAGLRNQGNFAGIRDEAVDALLERIVTASDLAGKEAATRALDRVLLSGWYVIPLWYNDKDRIAYWDRFGIPERMAKYSHGFPTAWWATR
jgi:microcin C transport system substrate-binding protein